MIQQLKNRIKKLVFKVMKPPTVIMQTSYSQAGEDAILKFLFNDFGKRKISFLDIGTNYPTLGNNTFLFYSKGSRGVCVEADASLISLIKESRPHDKVISVGVSVSGETEADFYVFDVDGLNTFSKEEADYRSGFGNCKVIDVIKVPLININDLIKDNFQSYPDLLSIDIEGLDLEVLKSLNYNLYPIPVICVETCQYSENHIRPKNHTIRQFMESVGYEVYADTYINTIFVNKKWFYNK